MNGYELTCERLVSLTAAYLEGDLSLQAKQTFEQHLVFCDECRVHLSRTRRLVFVLAALPRPEPPADLVDEVTRHVGDVPS